MDVYKIEILVINHDEMSEKDIVRSIENAKYPNRCISPRVKRMTVRVIEWDAGNHPLNINSKHDEAYRELFEK